MGVHSSPELQLINSWWWFHKMADAKISNLFGKLSRASDIPLHHCVYSWGQYIITNSTARGWEPQPLLSPLSPPQPHLIFEKVIKVPGLFEGTIWFLISLCVILVWFWTHCSYLTIDMYVNTVNTHCTALAKLAEINRFFVYLLFLENY